VVGIKSYGAYIPFYKLNRDLIAQTWGGRSAGGKKSVAGWDEDSITLATEAVFDCLGGFERENVGALYAASTTFPYIEKSCAAVISYAADLPTEIRTVDFANTLRAGTAALRAAFDAVQGGAKGDYIVTAADIRLGVPGAPEEQNFGDAAAALLAGDGELIAILEDSYSITNEMADVWRRGGESFVHSWEDRWVQTHGYTENVRKAVSEILKRNNLAPEDFAKAAFYSPNARGALNVARQLGFNQKQVQDPLISTIGDAGAAHALLVFVSALEEAGPGDRILLTSYGDGSDVFIFKVTEGIEQVKSGRRGIKGWLKSRKDLPGYGKYLAFRQVLPTPAEFSLVIPSATAMWRTRNWVERCHGSRCRRCGLITFPIQRVCYGCQARDEYDEVRLSDKKGTVFTYSLDYYAGGADAPIPQVILDLDTGEGPVRMYTIMTDCDAQDVKIGMQVELVLKKFHEYGNFHNYYWKCRPVR
jgi:3-hydroxy-3-methylglutaryl CoA synthase